MGMMIGRMQLIMALQNQYQKYGYLMPFVIDKDGRQVYDMTKDLLSFTCCGNIEHKVQMTPMQMLKLEPKYGPQPCAYCRADGVKINKQREIGEDPHDDMGIAKQFFKNDGSVDTDKLQKFQEEERRRAAQFKVGANEYNEGDIIVSAKSYDQYVKQHPDFQANRIEGDDDNKWTKTESPFSKKRPEFQPKKPRPALPGTEAEIKNEVSEDEMQLLASLGLAKPLDKKQTQQVKPDLKNILSDRETIDDEEED